MIAGSSSPSAQGRDSETAKQLEIALIKLGASEGREELQKQRITEKDATIKALDDAIAQRDIIIKAFSERRDASNAVDTGDARMLARCDQQVTKAEARITALEHPPFLARLFNPDVVLAGVGGFGLGRLTASKAGPVQITSNPFAQFANVGQGQYMMFQPADTDRMKQALKQLKLR